MTITLNDVVNYLNAQTDMHGYERNKDDEFVRVEPCKCDLCITKTQIAEVCLILNPLN